MNRKWIIPGLLLTAAGTLALQGCNTSATAAVTDMLARNKADTTYYMNRGQTRLSAEEARQAIQSGQARNIILFVGDGMGISTVTAARIFDGQAQNKDGESNSLYMESLPYLALSKTYSTNQQTADSAPTMTAMVTGVKTKEGFLSVAGDIRKNDMNGCAESNRLATIGEMAEAQGMSTGVVSTARLTHATPAAVYAHIPNRDGESDKDLNDLVAKGALGAGCSDIASQLVNFPYGNGLEVALGGGRRAFLPNTVTDAEGSKGRRTDGRDLTAEWLAKFPGDGAVVQSKDGLDKVNISTTTHLLGLFNASHMDYETDRLNDATAKGEPSLADMTRKAIEILSRNTKGYFLMVEGGRIDHAHHAGNAYRALRDAQALDAAVKVADDMTSDSDTLIIVTADHSHTLTIGGYPYRNNPLLGLTREADGNTGDVATTDAVDLFGKPYTTLMYANGLGYGQNVPAETNAKASGTGITDTTPGSLRNPRADLSGVNTQDKNYHQEALVALESETHAGEDVLILAKGPGAHLFRGIVEQSYIFHVMTCASSLLSSMAK